MVVADVRNKKLSLRGALKDCFHVEETDFP